MTSTNLQNGNTESDNLSTTPINQKNSINLRQTQQQQPPLPHHNLFNGNNKIPTQRVISGTPVTAVGNGGGGVGVEPNFEGLVMNRKITLNGGNELRIDDKNISLHLNNPFVTNYVSQQQHYAEGRSGPINPSNNVIRNPNFKGSENNLDECGLLYGDGRNRPKRPHSIAVSSPLNNRQNNDLSTIYSHSNKINVQPGRDGDKEPIYAHMYNQFKNSPSRLQSRSTHEFSLYQPPSPIANLQQQHQQQQVLQISPAGVVQRRSHSTPRPIQSFPQQQQQQHQSQLLNGQSTATVQRPRSLDRCNGIQTMDKNYKPPIPSRRMPQQSGINQNQILTSTPSSRPLQSSTSTGMRQSATFHGQLNRQAANYSFPLESNNLNNDAGTENGTRRKSDRPMSYAYGTLPDQVFLENQLRIYSEQLKSITESVRKYSEQAKLLSEMKRQQQMQKQHPLQMSASQQNINNNVPMMKNDSKQYQTTGGGSGGGGDISTDEPQTPSHQLKLFLDNIRSSMNNPSENNCDVVDKVPERSSGGDVDVQTAYRSTKIKDDSPSYIRPELKTPSDQLRHFLDAIRSNQVTEEDDIKGACDRFNKFKEKIESGRPKSVNIEKFRQSPSANESFSQISDNLRIMNEDLEALAAKSPSKLKFNQPPNRSDKPTLDFNQILDHFQRINGNAAHSAETMDYLRKCSESLKHSSDQLRISTMNNNNFGDSPESSSCSTTPGSIREAVQNLLMQPRNGFQIMDDRMKLFIDILDSQEKFSQVCKGFFGSPSSSFYFVDPCKRIDHLLYDRVRNVPIHSRCVQCFHMTHAVLNTVNSIA